MALNVALKRPFIFSLLFPLWSNTIFESTVVRRVSDNIFWWGPSDIRTLWQLVMEILKDFVFIFSYSASMQRYCCLHDGIQYTHTMHMYTILDWPVYACIDSLSCQIGDRIVLYYQHYIKKPISATNTILALTRINFTSWLSTSVENCVHCDSLHFLLPLKRLRALLSQRLFSTLGWAFSYWSQMLMSMSSPASDVCPS